MTSSKEIRQRLDHPVVDSDGHWREFEPIATDYLRDVAGAAVAERWTSRVRALGQGSFAQMSREEKFDRRAGQRGVERCHSIDACGGQRLTGLVGGVDTKVSYRSPPRED